LWQAPFRRTDHRIYRSSRIAAKFIARTAFLKSLRLLTAQCSSNRTASYAASTIVSVGRVIGLRAASANLRQRPGIILEIGAVSLGDGPGDLLNHADG
jgi:hypothetical protein